MDLFLTQKRHRLVLVESLIRLMMHNRSLINTFIAQLDNAISVLSNGGLTNQVALGSADVYYKGDYTKWVKLANSIKLRIAARLELQDNAKAQLLFQQVMQDATGPITSEDDQLTYQSIDYLPIRWRWRN